MEFLRVYHSSVQEDVDELLSTLEKWLVEERVRLTEFRNRICHFQLEYNEALLPRAPTHWKQDLAPTTGGGRQPTGDRAWGHPQLKKPRAARNRQQRRSNPVRAPQTAWSADEIRGLQQAAKDATDATNEAWARALPTSAQALVAAVLEKITTGVMVAQLDGNMRLSPNISFRGSMKLLKDVTPKYKEQNETLKNELENIKYDQHNNRLLFYIKSRQRVQYWSERQVPILGRFLQLVPTADSTDDPDAEVVALDEYEFAAFNPQGDFSARDLWILFGGYLQLTVVDIQRWGPDQDGTDDPTRWRITVRSPKSPKILSEQKVIGWDQQLVWIHHTRLHLLPPCSACGDNNHPPSSCAGNEEKRVKPKAFDVQGPRYDLAGDAVTLSHILAQNDEVKLADWARDATYRLANLAGMIAEDHPAPEAPQASRAGDAAERRHLLTLEDYANIPLLTRRPTLRDASYASLQATLRKVPNIEQKLAAEQARFVSAQVKLGQLEVVSIIRRLRLAYATNPTFSAYHDVYRWQDPEERARLDELRQTAQDATAAAAFVKKAIPAYMRAQLARTMHDVASETTETEPNNRSDTGQETTKAETHAVPQAVTTAEDALGGQSPTTRPRQEATALTHAQQDVSMQAARPVITKEERAKNRVEELKLTLGHTSPEATTAQQQKATRPTPLTTRTPQEIHQILEAHHPPIAHSPASPCGPTTTARDYL